MKAIHNVSANAENGGNVVYANAKILKWKQFTTKPPCLKPADELFMLMQRY